MRKRFISGLTAVCIVGILITNMITSASAVISAAVVGASVAGSLLLGTLFNQMCGGQGYDFTNAFQDAVKLYTDWEEDFDGSAKDPIHPVTKVEIDTSKVNIPDNVNFNSVGGTSADKMLIEMQKAINEGLEDGSIEISFDENGNISMPTTSYCNAVTSIYDNLGVVTSKNGLKRSTTLYSLVSPYISKVSYGWDYSYSKYEQYYAVPFVISSDGGFSLINIRLDVHTSGFGIYSGTGWTTYIDGSSSPCVASGQYSGCFYDYDGNYQSSFSLSSDCSVLHFSASCNKGHSVSKDISIPVKYRNTFTGKTIDYTSVQKCGLAFVSNDYDIYNRFVTSYNNGDITCDRENVSIPLTGVENTIGNMGLAGVGSGATKGLVSVNSKTKDITVTNEATKEAELVIEQGKPGDVDIPDSDTIIDKFPFSLPFDLYRMLTIFVVPEEKPIFTFPIETTITNGGLNYKIDEEIEVDLTRFQFMGQDIVRLVLRSTFYVGFVIMLIHVTSKFIKH
jgi:hypothetical protein